MTFWKPKTTWTPAAIARCLRMREEQVHATLKVLDANHSIAAWELDMLRRQVKFARLEARDFLLNPAVTGEERENLERIVRVLDRLEPLITPKDFIRSVEELDEAQTIGECLRLSYSVAALRLAAMPQTVARPGPLPEGEGWVSVLRLGRSPAQTLSARKL